MTRYYWFRCLCLVLLIGAIALQSFDAMAQTTSDELEELLDEEGDDPDVESEEEFELPLPRSEEERSPILDEIDQGPLQPSDSTEELFLPVPSDQVGLPQERQGGDFSPFYEEGDVRHSSLTDTGLYRKPGFAIFGGWATKDYGVPSLINKTVGGFEIGFNARIWGFPLFNMPISLNAFAAATFFKVGDIFDANVIDPELGDLGFQLSEVADRTYRAGFMVEWEISRRIQLMVGMYRYFLEFSAFEDKIGDVVRKLDEDRLAIGFGAQVEFYVIPHGSLGARIWIELRYVSVLLAITMEPIPQKRHSANFAPDE